MSRSSNLENIGSGASTFGYRQNTPNNGNNASLLCPYVQWIFRWMYWKRKRCGKWIIMIVTYGLCVMILMLFPHWNGWNMHPYIFILCWPSFIKGEKNTRLSRGFILPDWSGIICAKSDWILYCKSDDFRSEQQLDKQSMVHTNMW